jgi:fumarate hydratase, class II
MIEYRFAKDTMGEIRVPAQAYYGAQTQRAVENFPISGLRMPRRMIRALGLLKKCAAETNLEKKWVEEKLARAIIVAADDVIAGKLEAEFPIDIFQTGSGTSTNMNTNEVIAGRANEILGGQRGDKAPVHPNDHVNTGMSSNDTFPSAIHVAAMEAIEQELLPALRKMHKALAAKAREFDGIVKIGRTHLTDAPPIRLGQEFSGYASMIEHSITRVENIRPHLCELSQGGTVVGTGLNMHREFPGLLIAKLSRHTGISFTEASNHFEALGSRDAIVEASGALRTLAVSLMKIANDLRILQSGPRCSIGEIQLPTLQPGSSIVPWKVNPVLCEAVMMVCAQVMGNDTTIVIAGQHGNLELNVMAPVMAYSLLQSIDLLANVCNAFVDKCVVGIVADKARCEELVEKSLSMCAPLALHIGYDATATVAQEAWTTGKTVREICRERKVLEETKLAEVLDSRRMTEPEL